jgi:3-hydroxyisobutyrate dehydrogenase-like beta-hydroxyacid dehydrogenase
MQVGYLGVGNMGQPMAGKLLDGGHGLLVYDISEAAMEPLLLRQARRATSPKDVGDQCETVVVSLPTLAAFRAAVLAPEGLATGRTMKVLLNTCTVGVPFLREVEAALAPNGVTIVDCPISGGPAGARAGTLSVMVSGDPAAVEKVRPLISLWGQTLTIAGDKPGAAQVLKLTNNILFAVSLAATSEAFVMGAKGGLDPEVMVNAINAGSAATARRRRWFRMRCWIPSRCGPTSSCLIGRTRDLPVPVQGASAHARVSDHAGPSGHSRWRARPCCVPQSETRRHPEYDLFRGSMAGLCPPLPTLRRHPRECQRTARGRGGSLRLPRGGLAPPTPCRSPGALRLSSS